MIISVVNQKGGVGKTTTAVNVAAALAETGKFVLLVDLDPQGNATSGLGHTTDDTTRGLYHALVGLEPMPKAIFNTKHEGLRIIPATPDLAGANIELVSMESREQKLADLLLEVRHAYDYIIIDCPPSLGLLTINGLVAADQILVPVQAEYYALEGLGQLLKTIEAVQQGFKPTLGILGAVVTMYDGRNRLSDEVLKELREHFPSTVFATMVPRTVRLAEAPSFGKTIFHYEPGGKGARAYQNLAQEIIQAVEAVGSERQEQ